MQNRRNYYRVLHVQPDAPVEIIRTSYRTLMQRLRMHPDLGGDHWNAAIINEAFETLSDPVKRAAYDLTLRQRGRASPEHEAAATQGLLPLPGLAWSTRACAFCGTTHTAREASLPGSACASCGSPLYPAVKLQLEGATRRALDRFPRTMTVTYCLTWPATRQFQGLTEDLSIAGMRFTTDLQLVLDERLRLDCDFCSAVGVVRNAHLRLRLARRTWHIGVEFLTLRVKHPRGSLVSREA
jgi:curved DNA-binding protein CbpA